MTEFNSLLDGLQYITRCPLCFSKLEQWGDIKVITYGDDGWKKITIKADTNEIEVELRTGRIISIENKEEENPFLTGSTSYTQGTRIVSKIRWAIPTSGSYFVPIRKNCPSCNKYHLTLQVQFDMGLRVISKVLLNSEHLFYKEDGHDFQITNVYVMDKTEFTKITADGEVIRGDGKLELPLIPFDHKNVSAFIKRVKNLLIYT